MRAGVSQERSPVCDEVAKRAQPHDSVGFVGEARVHAGPSPVFRTSTKAGFHGVPLDVAGAGQQVLIGLDRRGTKALLPEVSLPPVRGIDLDGVQLMRAPEGFRQTVRALRNRDPE